jgi:hypothetical protein
MSRRVSVASLLLLLVLSPVFLSPVAPLLASPADSGKCDSKCCSASNGACCRRHGSRAGQHRHSTGGHSASSHSPSTHSVSAHSTSAHSTSGHSATHSNNRHSSDGPAWQKSSSCSSRCGQPAGPASVFSLQVSAELAGSSAAASYLPAAFPNPAAGGVPLDTSLHQRPPPIA